MNRQELQEFITDFFKLWKEGDKKALTFYDENVKVYSNFEPVPFAEVLSRFELGNLRFSELDPGIQDLFIDETKGKIAIRMKQNLVSRDDSTQQLSCEVLALYRVVNFKNLLRISDR